MPLLHKKPFVPNPFPPDLKDSEEVFFCKITKEIFREYDEFCERIILCNSLVWSCALTGRASLTYQEAATSEERVKRLLKSFPMELRIPVLYLASLCERTSLAELAEDVFWYVKDRYFIGETVQVNFDDGSDVPCHVLAVIPPTPEELANMPPQKPITRNGEKTYWPPAYMYKYEVERSDNDQEETVSAGQIYRKKSTYNKDKNKLYIKQFVSSESGYWKLKESCNIKYGISKVKFDQIFCGEPPVFHHAKKGSPGRKRGSLVGKRQETINKYFKHAERKYSVNPRNSPRKMSINGKDHGLTARRRRRSKKEIEEDNKNMAETKAKARFEKKRRRIELAEFVKDWNRKREDLECEDLKELPTPIPVEIKVPVEYFGDVLLLMEFLHSFRKILPVKDFFPNGLTLELIERALMEKEVAGPLCDIIQLFLCTIFDLQEQEIDECRETDVKLNPALVFERGDAETLRSLRRATEAETWVKKHHSAPVSKLALDTSTITEVLRLHFLTSGSRQKDKLAKWRYQARGGYCSNDDPGVHFRLQYPQLMDHLRQSNVCGFSVADKVSILKCLVNQIITYASTRETILQTRTELKALNIAEARREKEERLRGSKKGDDEDGSGLKGHDEDPESGTKCLRSTGVLGEDKKEPTVEKQFSGTSITPLGCDRALRRFWVFSSMPGLFVEHFEPNPGTCIPKGTPLFSKHNSEDSLAYIRRLFEETGNKENFSGTTNDVPVSSPAKKLLTEKNGMNSLSLDRSRTKSESHDQLPLTCWGDMSICPVHGPSSQQVSWGFYKDEADIHKLIECLNPRGIRERRLKQALIKQKENIIRNLPKIPIEKLNPSLEMASNGVELRSKDIQKVMKPYENANLSYPQGTSLDLIMENTLRDLILETEDKICEGGLGLLKVTDRDAWRKALVSQGYDKQCKKLKWGVQESDDEEEVKKNFEVKKEELIDNEEVNEDEQDIKIKKEDSESRSSTPSIDMSLHEFDPVIQSAVVCDLASAILQMEQSIDHKYLKRPLGLEQKERERGEKMPTSALMRWETSLMESTSFPQLFLHLSALDNSVMWVRSALNAYCRICRKRSDPEHMLLCDTCNKGHHLYCLKPKLTQVPSGDWHCPWCKPREKVRQVKRRRLFSEESGESENETEEVHTCKVCKENEAQLICDTCDTKYHLKCLNPPVRKAPKSKWFCYDCRIQNSQLQQKKEVVASDSTTTPVKPEKAANKEPTSLSSSARSSPKDSKDSDSERDSCCQEISPSLADAERSSRRRCSKAATAKISRFAKQLRSTSWDGDDDGEYESSERQNEGRRRSRRSDGASKSRDLPLDNAALQEILDTLMHHKDAWPFLRPVTKSEVPDYHLIIKRPMDFGTIKHKLNMLEYKRNSELIADAELLFENCFAYNQEGSEVYRAGEKLKKLFEKLCREQSLSEDDFAPPPKRSRTVL